MVVEVKVKEGQVVIIWDGLLFIPKKKENDCTIFIMKYIKSLFSMVGKQRFRNQICLILTPLRPLCLKFREKFDSVFLYKIIMVKSILQNACFSEILYLSETWQTLKHLLFSLLLILMFVYITHYKFLTHLHIFFSRKPCSANNKAIRNLHLSFLLTIIFNGFSN